MDLTIRELRQRLRLADMNTRLMVFTVLISLFVWLLHAFLSLLGADPYIVERWLWLAPDLYTFSRHPWTLFTYIWLHSDLWHLFFNMLWLYWFGQLFLRYQNPRRLVSVYLLGGLAGGLLYVLAVLFADAFSLGLPHFPLIGASASVMAIVFGVAFYARWERVNLLFIGRIKLTTLALILFVLDVLLLTGDNFGGHVAHIGGAAFGVWFALSLAQGKDITVWFQRLLDRMTDFFSSLSGRRKVCSKPRFRVRRTTNPAAKKSGTDPKTRETKTSIDEILDKIRISGYASLTAEEKRRLFDQSKRL
ncbi:rhomboid family intramembrane serine protease [Porphyromonas gingivalis]|uniref:rhomboid family intramembrane serine protease n=1 Tax=Porphyromonas gingivalis TaxID=837 RepID=UPI0007179BA9|nr:rhomboid family intramembrane serine protease [Porphyromonas gingivalis]ALO29304.1 putative membrane protein [Porphyromonas gingivalis A7A1-28]SJL27378.1 rhomboid family intramembrane serine protease [Porphyromonas gingivalis]